MTILFLKTISKGGIKDARTRSFKNTLLRSTPLSSVLKMTETNAEEGGGRGCSTFVFHYCTDSAV